MTGDQFLFKDKKKSEINASGGGDFNQEEVKKSAYSIGAEEFKRMNDAQIAEKNRVENKNKQGSMSLIEVPMSALIKHMDTKINKSNYGSDLQDISATYRTLIQRCDEYLAADHNDWSEDNNTKRMIIGLRKQIAAEYDLFIEAANRLKPMMKDGMVWGNILGEIRTNELTPDIIENAVREGDYLMIQYGQMRYRCIPPEAEEYEECVKSVGAKRLFNITSNSTLCADARLAMNKRKEKIQHTVIREAIDSDDDNDFEEKGKYTSFTGFIRKYGDECVYSPKVIQKLTQIKLFDIIMGVYKRNTDTLMVKAEKDDKNRINVTDIKIIKNPKAFSKTRFDDMNLKGFRLIDEDTCKQILNLDTDTLKYFFRDVASKEEMAAMSDRLMGLKNFIRREHELDEKRKPGDKTMVKSGKWGEKQVNRFVDADIDYLGVILGYKNTKTYRDSVDVEKDDKKYMSVDEAREDLKKAKNYIWGEADDLDMEILMKSITRKYVNDGRNLGSEIKVNKKRLIKDNDEMIKEIDSEILGNLPRFNDNKVEILAVYKELLQIYEIEKKIKKEYAENQSKTLARNLQYIDDRALSCEKQIHDLVGDPDQNPAE